jgi:hypothetical protein
MKKLFNKNSWYICLALCLLVSGCSGYRFKYKDNPFERHGIHSVSIPLFQNLTVFPAVAGNMTKEIKKVLETQTNLKVYAGNNTNADAVLIGIIGSAKHRRGAIKQSSTSLTTAGSRPSFYVPTGNTYKIHLKLILIKAPSEVEMGLLQTELLPYMSQSPKVIFSQNINLTGSFTRFADTGSSADDGTVVNFTRSKKAFEQSLEKLAISAASSFEGLILYAF